MSEMSTFGTVDAIVFIMMVLVAIVVGIFYGIKDRNKTSLKNYFYADQNMSAVPVGVSIGVTFVSSITILSIPVLTYSRGTVVYWYALSGVVAATPAFLYFIPFFLRLEMPSIFHYLELRFHSSVRKVCSFISCLLMVCWMGIATYLTSIALNVVFPLTVTQSTVLTAAIVTFYTVIGGIKAVVWVDTIQSVIMVSGVVAVCIKTSAKIGGVAVAWDALREDGRMTFDTFDPDLTTHYSFWSITFGLGISYANYYCCNQAFAQRFQSCRDVKQARVACAVSAFVTSMLMVISTTCGCLMYAYFRGCDPTLSGQIKFEDQTVPFLVLNVFRDVPGVAGLFVSAAYSAMLSTVSSGINSLSTLVLEDFIRPCTRQLTEGQAMRISKIIGILLGVAVMLASFGVRYVGDIAFVLTNTLESAFGGPLFALFVVAVFIPWINKIGGLVGFVCSVAVNLWLAIGYRIYGDTPGKNQKLPGSINNCSQQVLLELEMKNNATTPATTTTLATSLASERPAIADSFYQISYLYYSLVGLIVCFVVSLVVSFVTRKRDPASSDPAFFMPIVSGKMLPAKIERFFRFGVPSCSEANSDYLRMKSRKKRMELDVKDGKDAELEMSLVKA